MISDSNIEGRNSDRNYPRQGDRVFDESRLLSRINAVRLFVILAMMFGYASTMPLGPTFQESFALYGYDPSWHAIQVLFFLSGVMAYRSLSAGRTGLRYLSSRFWRNIPMLGFLTVATLLVLFPLFGTPNDSGGDFFLRVTKYVLLTTFCIDPGIRIQGLMDDAYYMCLVQGGLWTLRFGLILHILAAFTGRLKLLPNGSLLLCGTVATTLLYIIMEYVVAKEGIASIDNVLTALRLSYAFLIGMSIWAYKDTIMKAGRNFWLIPIALFVFASIHYGFITWTPLIEVSLSLFWMALSWGLLTTPNRYARILENRPNMVLILMVIGWPLLQTLLLINPDLGRWTLPLIALPLMLGLTGIIYWSLLTRTKHIRNRFREVLQ